MNQPVSDPQLAAVRTPPHSIEAEQSVLGGLLLDNTAFDRVSDRLRAEHFTSDMYRDVYTEISRQLSSGKACDVVTVFQALAGAVELTELNELAQYVPSTANLNRYADIIVERHQSRRLAAVAVEINGLAYDSTRDIAERVEAAQGQLAKLIGDAPRDESDPAWLRKIAQSAFRVGSAPKSSPHHQ